MIKKMIKRSIQNKLIMMVVAILGLITVWDIFAMNTFFAISQTSTKGMAFVFLQLIMGGVIGILFAILIANMITQPLKRLSRVAEEITKNDNLNVKITEINTGDEIEILGNTFNRMVSALKEARIEDKASNPLTGLPGNIILIKEIDKRIAQGKKFSVLYIDLSDFKMFNDKYGFERGDEVITFTAQTIADVVTEYGREDDFFGHIGGDDFMVITAPEREEKIATELIVRFDSAVSTYYDREDAKNGYVSILKEGVEEKAHIMTVSIAIVNNSGREIKHHGQISQLTAMAKTKAKDLGKSGFARL